MRKVRTYWAHIKTRAKDKAGTDRSSRPSTPAPNEPAPAIAPSKESPSESTPATDKAPPTDTPRDEARAGASTPLPPPQMGHPPDKVGQASPPPPSAILNPSQTKVSIHTPPTSETPVTLSPPGPGLETTTTHAQQDSACPPVVANSKNSVVSESLGWIKTEGWTNLKGLLDTLDHTANILGPGQMKTVIEGFAKCIGIYEEAAQGRKEFTELSEQLEGIFDQLKTYLSSSPTITKSVESICGLIEKEIEYVKAQKDRPRRHQFREAETDAENILKCYQRIKSHLERLSRNANISAWIIVDQIATESRLRELAPSLWACYNSGKANELKRRSCTEGTRTNVLAQMQQWTTGQGTGNLYWMSGMAGTGKTTIAYSLCEQLDQKMNRMLCASFFCSRSLPECRDVGRIIPSIAYQLAQFSRPFRYALSQATEKDPLAHTRLPQMQFESLIVEPLSNVEVRRALPTNMVVVIDALDECDDVKSTKQILGVLLAKSKDLPIKFMVSSRPEPAIRDQMEKNGTWVDERVVLHELDSGEVRVDIRTYLRAELNPIKPSEEEIEQLVARAGVLFIYAATVIRYVGYDDFGRNPQARLKAILSKTNQHVKAQTKDIDELYGAVLGAAFEDSALSEEERDDMKLILDTVICAREPLTVAALNNLLQLDDVDRVHAALRPLWSVLHVMGPDMTVATLHASFPDYLLDSKRSGAWHCEAAARHHLLAQRCFECIQVAKPQFNICRLESSYVLDSEVPDLEERVRRFISTELRYACLYWANHLDAAESQNTPGLMPLLSQFLTTHLLLWMEVKNLTKTFPATLGELIAARRWATRHDMTRDTINLLSDACRFASMFAFNLASQSTPHLYLSMLPLLPLSSPIRKHYSTRFQGMVGVGGSALDRRNIELLAQWEMECGVRNMACSPDGALVAINGNNGSVLLLDAYRENLLLRLSEGGSARVSTSIAFSPDSTRLVSGRNDGAISVWDVSNGRLVFETFQAHKLPITSVLYSRDGSYIFSACRKYYFDYISTSDHTIRVWDALSGKPALTPLTGHTDDVICMTISSDDAFLVSASDDQTIRVWDVQSGNLILNPLTAGDGWTFAVMISPDGSRIVSGSTSGVHVWDIQTGRMVLGPFGDHIGGLSSMAISPDGTTIAYTTYNGYIDIWDATSGQPISKLGPFPDARDNCHYIAYSHDGARIIFATGDGRILIIDTRATTPIPKAVPWHTSGIESLDISPSNQHIVSGSSDDTLCVWDLRQGILLIGPLQGHTAGVNMVRYSPDGNRIVSCSRDSTIRQWDAQSGADYGIPIEAAPDDENGIVSAEYSRDGARIVSLTYQGELSVWNSDGGQSMLGPIPNPSQSGGSHASFSPDDSTVIAGYRDGSIGAWDAQHGQMVFSHEGHERSPDAFYPALSPNGLYYAHSFVDGKLILKYTHTWEQMPGAFDGHTTFVSPVRFSSDSTRLVSADFAHTVHIWDVETGQSLFGPLNGHTDSVRSIAFSPDGKYVVSSSYDSTIRVWDLEPKLPLNKDRDIEYTNWVLKKDGWVVSGERRLFWVPTDLHTYLILARNTTLVSRFGYVRLKFEGAFIGKAWANCWRNS